MPRAPRLHVVGGCYHVLLRGNHRETLFGRASDRHRLNSIVAEVLDRCGARLHAFCWMPDHLHALLQVGEQPLGKAMQRIAMRYSRYRHGSLHMRGHLFERRYDARLVQVDRYFLPLLRYIHLNPVAARLATDPGAYPWSSHRAYLGFEHLPWLTTELGLSLLHADPARARRAYGRFMLQAASVEDTELERSHPQDARVLGTDQFLASLPMLAHSPRSSQTLEQLAHQLASDAAVTVEAIRSQRRSRQLTLIRVQLARLALAGRIANLRQVATYLQRDPSSLSQLLSRYA